MSGNTSNQQKIPVIHVVGAGHSGSTLLDLIMDSHSQIVGVGEMSHFYRSWRMGNWCSCGYRLQDCSFWNTAIQGTDYQALDRMHQNKYSFFLGRTDGFYYGAERKENEVDTERYTKALADVYRRLMEQTGASVVFDSSKSPERAWLLMNSDLFDVYVLHLVRDGRGVLYSHTKHGRAALPYIISWVRRNIRATIVRRRASRSHRFFVRYEDFVHSPERLIRGMLEKIGLSLEPQMMNFRAFDHHQAGGNVALRIRTFSRTIQQDVTWRKKLTFQQRIVFAICGGLFNWWWVHR